MTSSTRPRDYSINSLRAFAIGIVVFYHAMGDTTHEPGSFYAEFLIIITYIPLEIFTAISGYLYALRPTERSTMALSLRVKARRLLVPLVSATTLLLCLRALVPGVNEVPTWTTVWRAYFFRFEHLWYLQALFLIFVVMAFVDGYRLIPHVRAWVVAVVTAFVLSVTLPLSGVFGYAGLVQLMPFFLVGYGLQRWPELLESRRNCTIAWIALIAGTVVQQLEYRDILMMHDVIIKKFGLLNFIVGSGFCFLTIRYRRRIPGLDFIGKYTFSIYIFHTIGMAIANRVGAVTPWEESYDAMVGLKFGLGIGLPIAFEYVCTYSAILSTLFLGDAWKPRWPVKSESVEEKQPAN